MKTYQPLLLIAVLILFGCANSKVSTIGNYVTPTSQIEVIAMSPNGGLLGEAVAIELFNLGYNIVDTESTQRIFARLGLDEIEISRASGIKRLKEEGIDAYLVIKSASGHDGLPQSATARLTETETGKILAGVSWQNGWGGQAGSPADRMMRQDISEAAREIVKELSKAIAK
jgi:hypothetical protein